jgi:hypothetical protein
VNVLAAVVTVLALAACGSGSSTTGSTTTSSGVGPVYIEFRPVLSVSSVIGLEGLPAGTAPDIPGTDVVLSLEEAEYHLGPPLADGDMFESAEAVRSPNDEWVVNPTFKRGADGIDQFNAAAEVCFDRAPECPTGQLAIVIDGELVSAPSVNERRFERDQIQISGGFTEREAKILAARINGDPPPSDDELGEDDDADSDHDRTTVTEDAGASPSVNDHWHSAFGIYVCDRFLPDPVDVQDRTGIHTHNDGIIHIHPFSRRSGGENATFDAFADSVDMSFGGGSFVFEGRTYDDTTSCDGVPATVVLYEWHADDLGAEPIVHRGPLGEVRFTADRQAFTLAIVADGAPVPRPPSVPTLDRLADIQPLPVIPGE